MAGSYSHVTDDEGRLLDNESFVQMIENLGDAYEAVEEMYGMIWFLADGNATRVRRAQGFYREGLEMSPGVGSLSLEDDE